MHGVYEIDDLGKSGKFLSFFSVLGAVSITTNMNIRESIGLSLINLKPEYTDAYEILFFIFFTWFFIRFSFYYKDKWKDYENGLVAKNCVDGRKLKVIKKMKELNEGLMPIFVNVSKKHSIYVINIFLDEELKDKGFVNDAMRLRKVNNEQCTNMANSSGRRVLKAIEGRVDNEIEGLLRDVINYNMMEFSESVVGYRLYISKSLSNIRARREIYNQIFWTVEGINNCIPLILASFFLGLSFSDFIF